MNSNRNLVINFFITKYRRNKAGQMIFERQQHDHWINKEKHVQPHMSNDLAHKHRATHKKYRYKKAGTGGYGR